MSIRKNTFLIKRSGVPGKIPNPGDLQLGELALNFADAILYASGTTSNSILPIGWDRVSKTGDTMSGGLFTPYLSATTISATTYLNLPLDVYVTGGTYSGGDIIFTNNSGGTFNVSGLSSTDTYVTGFTYSDNTFTLSRNNGLSALTQTINTMTGLTVNGNLSATTISVNNYIDFYTGTTSPSLSSGRVFYNNTTYSLAYYPDSSQDVVVNMGLQQYIRVHNSSGSLISKGKAVMIQSAANGLPIITLAVNTNSGNGQVVGLSASDISNGSDGFVLTHGILSGLTVNTFSVGDIIYLSDTTPGGFVANTSSLAFSARTNQIGYIVETGTTTGKIFVSINNEDMNLSLTDIERNILEGNVISTGAYEYTGITSASTSTINIAPLRGWLVKNTYTYATSPDVINLYYTGQSNVSLTNILTSDITYLLINSGSTLIQQTTYPTPQERRENIFIGAVQHPNRSTISIILNKVDFEVSPMSALRDLWRPLKLINDGILVSANGANLNINTSSGTLYGNGIGWVTNQLNPDTISISANSPATFAYRTQTGGTYSATTTIDPAYYDLNGVRTLIGGGSNSSTNQRVFLLPTGDITIQYGQKVYGTLTEAVAGSQTEQFTTWPPLRDTAILIGIISINKSATLLNNTAQAVFNFVSKFGEVLGGTGGLSTTTLQQAYDNSSQPEITINSTLDGLSIKNGTGNADNVTRLLEGITSTNGVTSFIRADGYISGTTFQSNGFIANNGGATASTLNILSLGSGTSITNLGIDINGRVVSGTTGGSIFTGGTVTGSTNFISGLTASTIYTDYIDFNTNYTGNVVEGRLQWDDGNGTLVLGLKGGVSDIEIGLENMALCYNAEATTLTAGTIVYVSGSQGNRPAIKRALAISDGYSVTTLGMVSEPITSGSEGFVTTFGMVNKLNTTGLSGGTPIWLSPTVAGGYTTVKPQAPNHTVLIGYVVRIDNTVGSVFIHISNGWELDEIHDVRINGRTQGDLLSLSAYNGSNVWVNTKTLNGSYTITGNTTIGGNLTATTISATTYQNLPSGSFGVSNSNGVYTYYNSFNNAISAATSGQTVEMFGDVIETGNVSITLKDGVTINGNGHTYTLSYSGTSSAFIDGNTTTRKDCIINNIIIKRTNGTNSLTDSLAMLINGNTTVYCNDVLLISSFGTGLYVYGQSSKPAKVIGVNIKSDNTGVYINGDGSIKGTLVKCYSISNGIGIYLDSNGSEVYDSYGESSTNYGVYNKGIIYNTTSVSHLNSSMYLEGEVYGSRIICNWNDSNGHGIVCVNNNGLITNSSINVTNSGSYCLYSSSSINVKYSNNSFKGSITPLTSNISQGIINVKDNQGNILI